MKHLLSKGVPKVDIPFIYDNIFENSHLSRLTPARIINAFQNVSGCETKVVRYETEHEPNKYYDMAKKKYSEQDLKTKMLILLITKPR